MLVLSRRENETITIGDDITVMVVDIRGDKVRLGIQAPVEIPVHRREVYDAIQALRTEEPQMKLSDLQTDQHIVSRSGHVWRITAVNAKGEQPHILADAVNPKLLDGASSVSAAFRENELLGFRLASEVVA